MQIYVYIPYLANFKRLFYPKKEKIFIYHGNALSIKQI